MCSMVAAVRQTFFRRRLACDGKGKVSSKKWSTTLRMFNMPVLYNVFELSHLESA